MERIDIATLKEFQRAAVITAKYYMKCILTLAELYVENNMKLEVVDTPVTGAFGTVFIAREHGATRRVAVKVVADEKCIEQEKSLWPRLKHPNILRLLDVQYISRIDSHIFVTEQYERELETYVGCRDFVKNREALGIAKGFLKDILEGLAYLHDRGLIHLNLRAKHIWISRNYRAIITNFNSLMSAEVIDAKTPIHYQYGPPEAFFRKNKAIVFRGAPYDVWCFGLIALQMFTKNFAEEKLHGCVHWYAKVYPVLFKILQKEKFRKRCEDAFSACSVDGMSAEVMRNLVTSGLRIDMARRPLASKLLKHKYFLGEDGILLKKDEAWTRKIEIKTSWIDVLKCDVQEN